MSGRLDELVEDGCRPIALFAAAGLAASLPFLLLALAGLALGAGLLTGAHLAGWASTLPPGFGARPGLLSAVPVALPNFEMEAAWLLVSAMLHWLVAAALYVGLSAIRRRPATAVADAYALTFCIIPAILRLVPLAALATHYIWGRSQNQLLDYSLLAAQALLAAFLWSVAAYRIEHPDQPLQFPKLQLVDPKLAALSLRDDLPAE